jgi:hypothetical protein
MWAVADGRIRTDLVVGAVSLWALLRLLVKRDDPVRSVLPDQIIEQASHGFRPLAPR